MRNHEKKLNMLGLAMRARQIVTGDELVHEAIAKGQVTLALCANDASENTRKKITLKCERNNIPLNTEFTKIEISHAIGKSRTIVALTNRGMAKKFLSYDVLESEESSMS